MATRGTISTPSRTRQKQQREVLNAAERAAVQSLLSFGGKENDCTCQPFLKALETAQEAFKVEKRSRSYRKHFTINYRVLLPDAERRYRADLLPHRTRISSEFRGIWVNGETYELSEDTIQSAEALRGSWAELMAHLQLLQRSNPASWPPKSDFKKVLARFDSAWANFEECYVMELERIQAHARQIVLDCIEHERNMLRMEKSCPECSTLASGVDDVVTGKSFFCVCMEQRSNAEYRQEVAKLVECMCRLNSLANTKGKGRSDLSTDILWDAMAIVSDSSDSTERQGGERLAVNVGKSFQRFRWYLRLASLCIEKIDPHLANNHGLVDHLVDWEESWELAAKYMKNSQMLGEISQVFGHLKQADHGMVKMMEDCDADFCLGLPRLVWLRFLKSPKTHFELLQSFLPPRFPDASEVGSEGEMKAIMEPCITDSGVQELMQKYSHVKNELMKQVQLETEKEANGALSQAGLDEVEHLLARQAFIGLNCEELCKACGKEVTTLQAAASDLMHSLEKLSMELQRCQPQTWNQYMAVIMQRITPEQQGPRQISMHTFRV